MANKEKEVVIFGGGKLATYAQVCLDKYSRGQFKVAAFTMHEQYVRELELPQLRGKIVTPFEGLTDTYPPERYAMFVAVGSSRLNRTRAEIYRQCKEKGYEMVQYIHPKAEIGEETRIGDNTFILQLNNIDHFVEIGDDTFLWAANHIGHESVIGNHVFIASGVTVSGSCRIGDYTFIGVNAAVADGVTIAPHCFIGMGTYISKNTKEKEVYRGPKSQPEKYSTDRLR